MNTFISNTFSKLTLAPRLAPTITLMVIGTFFLATSILGHLSGKTLSYDEMKSITGGADCKICETTATAQCPLASYECEAPIRQGGPMLCLGNLPETICSLDTMYKRCVPAGPDDTCSPNNSGATPCGHKTVHKCKWIGGTVYPKCINQNITSDPPVDCPSSHCTSP